MESENKRRGHREGGERRGLRGRERERERVAEDVMGKQKSVSMR